MASTMRRSFAVTFTREGDPAVLECLHRLDTLTAELRSLARQGKCSYTDTITDELEPVRTVSYLTIFQYFKDSGLGGNRSKTAANVMLTLFDARGPNGVRVVRFYCKDYHHQAEVCTCPSVTRVTQAPPRRIRFRMLSVIAVARGWLIDRADLLALTDEQLSGLDVHPNTRQHTIDFVTWLRDHPTAP